MEATGALLTELDATSEHGRPSFRALHLDKYPAMKQRMEEALKKSFAAVWVCEYCNAENSTDDRRCHECGAAKI